VACNVHCTIAGRIIVCKEAPKPLGAAAAYPALSATSSMLDEGDQAEFPEEQVDASVGLHVAD
jgi:hypothetical protein